jgi:hypothetical protein
VGEVAGARFDEADSFSFYQSLTLLSRVRVNEIIDSHSGLVLLSPAIPAGICGAFCIPIRVAVDFIFRPKMKNAA